MPGRAVTQWRFRERRGNGADSFRLLPRYSPMLLPGDVMVVEGATSAAAAAPSTCSCFCGYYHNNDCCCCCCCCIHLLAHVIVALSSDRQLWLLLLCLLMLLRQQILMRLQSSCFCCYPRRFLFFFSTLCLSFLSHLPCRTCFLLVADCCLCAARASNPLVRSRRRSQTLHVH